MSEPATAPSGLVAMRVKQIDGAQGAARLFRRSLHPREERTLPEQERRNSRVGFARDFGLYTDSESEVDMDLLIESDEDAKNTVSCNAVSTFVLDDSDEDDAENEEIDDEYDFDHEKLAELVKMGAETQKLTEVVECAMAAALERTLARKAGKDPREASVLARAAAEAASAIDPWDLEGHMTPRPMTPTEDFGACTMPAKVDDVVERAQQALASANARRRRSSAARKHAAGITQAVHEAHNRRRQSLANKFNAMGEAQDKIKEAMEVARGRHRKSVAKAADILEDAGYDESDVDASDAVAKMRVIQQAMEDARRRHRRSIAQAVRELDERPSHMMSADAQVFTPQMQCNSDGMQRGGHDAHCAPLEETARHSVGEWSCDWTSPQDRVRQAVSSAYYNSQYFDYSSADAAQDCPAHNCIEDYYVHHVSETEAYRQQTCPAYGCTEQACAQQACSELCYAEGRPSQQQCYSHAQECYGTYTQTLHAYGQETIEQRQQEYHQATHSNQYYGGHATAHCGSQEGYAVDHGMMSEHCDSWQYGSQVGVTQSFATCGKFDGWEGQQPQQMYRWRLGAA